ncbi:hypothetical protein ACFE04_000077 [Oxalis oulophora]
MEYINSNHSRDFFSVVSKCYSPGDTKERNKEQLEAEMPQVAEKNLYFAARGEVFVPGTILIFPTPFPQAAFVFAARSGVFVLGTILIFVALFNPLPTCDGKGLSCKAAKKPEAGSFANFGTKMGRLEAGSGS